MATHQKASCVLLFALLASNVRCNLLGNILSSAGSNEHSEANGTKEALRPNPPLTTPTELCNTHQCGCYTDAVPKKIDCSYKHISNLNRLALPNHVIELSLTGNNLTHVLDTYFYTAPGVHVLDLSHNRIQFIAFTALRMFTDLNRLTLSYNRLASLEEEVFNGLRKLQYLDLSYNKLSTLYPKDFDHLDNLTELNLAHNSLMEFNGNALVKLTSLRKLSLQSTGLSALRQNDFDSLTNLKWLDLSGNGFDEVPFKGLHRLGQLTHLDLGRNPITVIKPYSFYNLTSLRSLSLKYMGDLTTIEAHAFSDVTSLKSIDLSFCPRLAIIDRRAFTYNGSDGKIEVDEFYARQTALKTLPESLLRWDYVTKVDFAENDWKCDCKLEWMPHVVKRDVIDGKLRCGSPKELEGRLIAKLNSADMPCAESVALEHPGWKEINVAMRVALGLLITVTVVLAIAIATMLFFKLRAKPHMYLSLKHRFGYSAEE
ncbi:hypothetical protein V5799_022727 [Amblyomma americanum]|uniref:LRRCT domain-containing protein n=1 Tax=Amblyomma americanum TaxID=6943 RepID=A0AAQ4FJJ2_AMBAM